MNATTEYRLWQIRQIIESRGLNATAIFSPLEWFVTTGRCTGAFVLALNRIDDKRKLNAIANRLIKSAGNYETAIAAVRDYIGE